MQHRARIYSPKALPRSGYPFVEKDSRNSVACPISRDSLGDNLAWPRGEKNTSGEIERPSFFFSTKKKSRYTNRNSRSKNQQRSTSRGQSARLRGWNRRPLSLERNWTNWRKGGIVLRSRCRVVSCQLVPSLYEPPLLLANLTLPLFVSFTRPRRRCSPRQRCCIRATSNDNERPPRTHALPPYDTHFVHLSCLPRTAPSIPSACARVPIRATVLCHMRERAFVGTRCRYRNLWAA